MKNKKVTTKEIKIGIPSNGNPCRLEGEVTLIEIDKIMKSLQAIRKNFLDAAIKEIGGNQVEDYEE